MLRESVHLEEINESFDKVGFYEDLQHFLRMGFKQFCQKQYPVQLAKRQDVLNLADNLLHVRLNNRKATLLKRIVVQHQHDVAVYFRAAGEVVD